MSSNFKKEIIRNKGHLKRVRAMPCYICGAWGCAAHHLLRAEKRGMGIKTGDNFTIPLCHKHHSELHLNGNEIAYFELYGIDYPQVIEFVNSLYESTLQGVKIP